ncbi:MAG TPA: 30S ribosomal protein S18 [Sedimentisphaerales bacterium]|nr:30S ribosomal protein S18 [Sedimentisphaerales bacterium]
MVLGKKRDNAEGWRSSEPDRDFSARTGGRKYTDRAGPGRGTEGSQSRQTVAGAGQISGRTLCRFCRRGISYVDYKDVETLQKLLTNRGKIYSRKRSGNCAACQRKVKKAIKRARYMALLPFTR